MKSRNGLLHFSSLLFSSLALTLALPADGASPAIDGKQVFEESFEKQTKTPDKPWRTILQNKPKNGIEITADSKNRFGKGRSNKILEYRDRKSTRLNSSHVATSYAAICLKNKNNQ